MAQAQEKSNQPSVLFPLESQEMNNNDSDSETMLTTEQDNLKALVPPRSILKRNHRLPVDNTREEIMSVNETPGKKIILYANGGGYVVQWYYGQTDDGRFYKQVFVGFERTEEMYYLDGPLDPNKVC